MEAAEIANNARQVIADCQDFDKSEILSSSDRREVSELLPIIEREAANIGPAGLSRKLQVATETGSTASQYCWLLVANGERAKILSDRQQGGGPAVIPFASALEELDRALFEEHFNELTSEADKTLREAEAVVRAAYLRRHDAKDMAGTLRYSADELLRDKQRYDRGGREMVPVGSYKAGGPVAHEGPREGGPRPAIPR